MPSTDPSFVHRYNYDQTFDTICTRCFATVSSSLIEATLQIDEIHHHCTGTDGGATIQNINAQMDQKRLAELNRSRA